MTMTPRERLRAALDHQEADRVPIDFGGTFSTGISAIAYNRLKKHLGMDHPTYLYDVQQQLALPDLEMINRMHSDVVMLPPFYPSFVPINAWKDTESLLPDGSTCIEPAAFNPVLEPDGSSAIKFGDFTFARKPKDGLYYDLCAHSMAHIETIEQLDMLPINGMSDEEVEFERKLAKDLYEKTDKALVGMVGGSFFEMGGMDFGYERYFCSLIEDEDFIHHYNERTANMYIARMEKYLGAVGEYLDVVTFGDDLGNQRGPSISPDMYRRMIKPYHAKVFQWMHEHYPHLKVFLHSCGAIKDLIPDLIDAGVQCLNPIQLSAAGMDPRELKQKFGSNLTFWGGGCNTAGTGTFGKPADVEREVRELMSILAPGGGFVFCSVHNIQPDVPAENIVAMFDTAYACGAYPMK